MRADLYRASIRDFNAVRNGTFAHLGTGQTWEQNGPCPAQVSTLLKGNGQWPGPNTGAVIDLAIDPTGSADQVVYAVFNDGGIWKTSDGGDSWTPKTDSLETLSFGAIALSPRGQVIYAATGNFYNNGYYKAVGIYRSGDRGDTWTLLPGSSSLFRGVAILKMVMPSSDLLLVAALNGLYRSTDEGGSFHAVPLGASTDIVTDLKILPADTDNVWAGVSSQGLFHSNDGGQTFTNLWTAANGGPAAGTYHFVSVAVASNKQTIYAVVAWTDDQAAQHHSNAGFFKSIDGGSTWSYLPFPEMPSGFPCWRYLTRSQRNYDQTLGVDPTDANRLYMGFQDLWVSEDGGATWRDATFEADSGYSNELMHVDHHALVFSPNGHRAPGDAVPLWVGNDGGIWKSNDHGSNWINRNGQIATNLFLSIDTGRGADYSRFTYGGMQDTGTAVGMRTPGSTTWTEFGGGDGGPVAVDPTDGSCAYGTWVDVIATTDGGATLHRPAVRCDDSTWSAGGFSDLAAGSDRQIYLAGVCSKDGQSHNVLFKKPVSSGDFAEIFTTPDGINRIALTAADTKVVWLGLKNGSLVKATCDSSGAWTTAVVTIPNGLLAPATVAINPANANQVVVGFSCYSEAHLPEPSRHVFLSTDGGANWTDISGIRPDARVPDMPIYSVAIDPNTSPNAIAVATDLGVLRTYDYGSNWHTLSSGYPNVHTSSLALDATLNPSVLKAGTYGRSSWLVSMSLGKEVLPPLSDKKWSVGIIDWTNNSPEPVTLSSIDVAGNEIAIETIDPDRSPGYGPAYFVGVNTIRDTSGNLVLVYLINETQNQGVTISADAVSKAKTNAIKSFPGFRSLPNMVQVSGDLYVSNQSNTKVTIWWYDSEGQRHLLQSLESAQTTRIAPIYFGGMFLFTDSTDKMIEIYVVTDGPTNELTITQAAVDFWT